MQGYVVLLVVSIAGLVMSWFRYDAGRQRKATLARLADELPPAGVISPTEALFRSEGIPVSDELRQGLATAPPAPPLRLAPAIQSAAQTAAQTARNGLEQLRSTGATLTTGAPAPADAPSRSDLAALVAGIELPCGLVPLVADAAAPIEAGVANFVTTSAGRPEVHDELHSALARIGCSVTWIDDTTAQVRRGPDTAVVTLTERPGDVVVKLIAT